MIQIWIIEWKISQIILKCPLFAQPGFCSGAVMFCWSITDSCNACMSCFVAIHTLHQRYLIWLCITNMTQFSASYDFFPAHGQHNLYGLLGIYTSYLWLLLVFVKWYYEKCIFALHICTCILKWYNKVHYRWLWYHHRISLVVMLGVVSKFDISSINVGGHRASL